MAAQVSISETWRMSNRSFHPRQGAAGLVVDQRDLRVAVQVPGEVAEALVGGAENVAVDLDAGLDQALPATEVTSSLARATISGVPKTRAAMCGRFSMYYRWECLCVALANAMR